MKRMIMLAMMMALFVNVNGQVRARRVSVVAPLPQAAAVANTQTPVVVEEKTPVYIDTRQFLQNQIGVEEYVEAYLAANAPHLEVVAEKQEAEYALEIIQLMPDQYSQYGVDPRQQAINESIQRAQQELYYRTPRSRFGYAVTNILVGSIYGFQRTPSYRDITVKVDVVLRMVPLHSQERVNQKRGTDIYALKETEVYNGRRVLILKGGGSLSEIGLDPKTDLSGFERYFLGMLSLKRQLDLMFLK